MSFDVDVTWHKRDFRSLPRFPNVFLICLYFKLLHNIVYHKWIQSRLCIESFRIGTLSYCWPLKHHLNQQNSNAFTIQTHPKTFTYIPQHIYIDICCKLNPAISPARSQVPQAAYLQRGPKPSRPRTCHPPEKPTNWDTTDLMEKEKNQTATNTCRRPHRTPSESFSFWAGDCFAPCSTCGYMIISSNLSNLIAAPVTLILPATHADLSCYNKKKQHSCTTSHVKN